MLALGTSLPAFRLPDVDGRLVSPDDVRDAPALLIAFICHHCPFVRHIRHEFARVTREYQAQGLAVIAINSNDIEEFPQDGPEGMRQESREAGYTFPYLFDEDQALTKAVRNARLDRVASQRVTAVRDLCGLDLQCADVRVPAKRTQHAGGIGARLDRRRHGGGPG